MPLKRTLGFIEEQHNENVSGNTVAVEGENSNNWENIIQWRSSL